MARLTRIHVNQHLIRAGDPQPLTVKDYQQNRNAAQADIVVDGKVVASIVYRPEHPLSCGAKCWIETTEHVEVHQQSIGAAA